MSLLLSALDGRIALKGVLGTGGMGEVHRAWDAALERPVAVKFVRSSDPKEADRLVLEARLQSRVEHPNVVRVYDSGTLDGRSCILLQLVEGQTFAELRIGVDWRAKVQLAAQAARGLGAAHRMGLVHRDVKPANILVEETEQGLQALLSDFGLARDEEGGLTRSGLMMGTVDFMAPEQVTGAAPVDYRADIYGLGATLYAVLAGRPPFRDSARSTAPGRNTEGLEPVTGAAELRPGDLLRRVLEENPKPLSAEVPGLPKDLSVVIAKAMEKEPAQRYATADALADDLERVLKGDAILARPARWLDRTIKWSRRNRMAARAIAGAGLLLLLGLGYTLLASRRASLDALDNARMGAEAAAMANALNREYLLPIHDLRPAIRAIRHRMAAIDTKGSRTEAPRAYALGRAHQLLEAWPEARSHLERARALGFRTAEGELAYGVVLAELYEEGLRLARTIPNPEVRKARLETLRKDLLTPAVAAIRAQAPSTPERTYTLLGRMALLEGRPEEALQQAKEAQASPTERAEGLFLEAKVYLEQRDALYLKHSHKEALEALGLAMVALEEAHRIARSDPRVVEGLVQCSLLTASHQRSMGTSTVEALTRAQSWLDVAKSLLGSEARLTTLEATLLQRISMSKKDVGQSGVAEDAAALALLQTAAALHPDHAELQRFLANAYYSNCYAKVAAGQDPGQGFQEGYRAVEAAMKVAPLDWRMPYTGALLAQPESTFLNNRGLDARMAAQRGIGYADKAIVLGAAANATGIRGDCLVELAKAQYAAGENPSTTLARIMEDNGRGVEMAPTDQIMRINAAAAAVQSAQLVWKLQGDVRPYLEKGAAWNEGSNPKYLEGQRNRLDLRFLQLQAGSAGALLEGSQALIQECLGLEKQFHTALPLQVGRAFRLKALAQVQGEADPSAAFAEARRQFLQMEKADPSSVQAYAESAFTCLAEARWRLSRGQSPQTDLALARTALARSKSVQAAQPLLAALEAAALCIEADRLPANARPPKLQMARDLWAEALKGNLNLRSHPEFTSAQAVLKQPR